jgi:excisionase family DNA binding protein
VGRGLVGSHTSRPAPRIGRCAHYARCARGVFESPISSRKKSLTAAHAISRPEVTMTPDDIVSAALNALPRLLTPTEAALVTRRSTRTIRRWIGAGLLRVVRPAGGNPLVPRSEIERLLREGSR